MKWGNLFDIASIGNQIEELEQKASEPDFWNDTENSQKILQKIKSLRSKVERYNKLVSQWEDLITLCELGIEEQDESVIPEAVEGFKAFKKEFEALRLETLLPDNMTKQCHPDLACRAGGTEAQDWVQMLFRMYTRWAEKKGFTVKVLDYLDGEEAGIKVLLSRLSGENAYGFLKSEKEYTGLSEFLPLMLREEGILPLLHWMLCRS